jgi:hypothetical protein
MHDRLKSVVGPNLVARKPKYDEASVLVLVVEGLESLVLRCEPTASRNRPTLNQTVRRRWREPPVDSPSGRNVDDQDDFVLQLGKIVHVAAGQLSLEVVKFRGHIVIARGGESSGANLR